jgi:hypothetical protein
VYVSLATPFTSTAPALALRSVYKDKNWPFSQLEVLLPERGHFSPVGEKRKQPVECGLSVPGCGQGGQPKVPFFGVQTSFRQLAKSETYFEYATGVRRKSGTPFFVPRPFSPIGEKLQTTHYVGSGQFW